VGLQWQSMPGMHILFRPFVHVLLDFKSVLARVQSLPVQQNKSVIF